MAEQLSFDFGRVEVPHIDNPTCTNDVLVNLQFDYITTGSRKAEAQLWTKFRRLCFLALHKEAASKGLLFGQEDIDDIVSCAMLYVMRRYSKYKARGEVYIIRHFATAARMAVMHALYSTSERDIMLEACHKVVGKTMKEVGADILALAVEVDSETEYTDAD